MDEYDNPDIKAIAVPKSRLSRLSKLGGLAGRVAGNMLVDGSKEWVMGRKPSMKDLLISEKNLRHLADKLATMRGAAMKAGQLLSMDAGSLVPEELAIILDRLRNDAVIMPSVQLIEVLERNWGEEWADHFQRFSFSPVAAASIGQVHRALSQDHREMAIKIQYPGVKESIDSDLDNVFGLLKMSGLIPKELDITPLVDEARIQLKLEADYLQEGRFIEQYSQNMSQFKRRDELLLPDYHRDLSTEEILCMSFLKGQPLEKLVYASDDERDRVMTLMLELFFAEFLKFHCVQTDPNLANFLYNIDSKQLVLLDFGATRQFSSEFVTDYYAALAAVNEDRQQLSDALQRLGFFHTETEQSNLEVILDIFILATEPMRYVGKYDFSASDLAQRIRDKGMSISSKPDAWHTPPPDVLFLHRKMAGLYLIATKLKARVDVAQVIKQYM
ncbi:ABC1 kinase family protein [Neptuniibacter caesariensis]|uniref:ABC-1 n=1 Tax=Neptuniibacter caesariensis TaxID=207954 RepID=A0A7U8C3D1_NEPCE|nr:AarF/ABC1/UbiB kinase family protein [Neptuniibacter caesariensis]EAR60713.1 ABC-1 [Neptuniibacter caesariensis]